MINITTDGRLYQGKANQEDVINIKLGWIDNTKLEFLITRKEKSCDLFLSKGLYLSVLFRERDTFVEYTLNVLYDNGFINKVYYTKSSLRHKDSRKAVLQVTGYSPTTLHKHFRAALIKLMIDPIRDLTGKLCIFNKNIKWDLVMKCWVMKDELRQAMRDGLTHITPIMMYYQRTPKKLKQVLGKSAWKSLCKNTFGRNLLICSKSWGIICEGLILANRVPTTLLRGTPDLYPTSYLQDQEIIRVLKELKSRKQIVYKRVTSTLLVLINDTLNQAAKLGKKPKLTSVEKIQQLHDKYTLELLERESGNLSDKPITIELDEIVVASAYTFTPIVSEKDLWMEGHKMHHCVYSYLNAVKKGSYYVYHVSGPDVEETIGMVYSSNKWFLDQIYGHCNQKSQLPEWVLDMFLRSSKLTRRDHGTVDTKRTA